jgi:ATP/maltotriose-dependent transcriptional regulator MalT
MKGGASPISPMIARRVLAKYRMVQSGSTSQASARPAASSTTQTMTLMAQVGLSTREQEVLELIARGFSYAEIARIKQVSVHTGQTHIKGLYSKLAVYSKSEAVYEATVQNRVFHDASKCGTSLDKIGLPIKYELPNQATI